MQLPAHHFLRRPLIGLALAFIAGCGCAGLLRPWPPLACAGAGLGLLILAWLAQLTIQRRQHVIHGSVFSAARPNMARILSGLAHGALYLAVAAAAAWATSMRLDDPAPHALAALLERPREGLWLEGVISGDPQARPAQAVGSLQWSFPLRVEQIQRQPTWQAARGRVQVILSPGLAVQRPQYGQRWRLAGVLVDNARFPLMDDQAAALTSPQAAQRPTLEWVRQRYTFRADEALLCGAQQGQWLLRACFRLRQHCAVGLARGIAHRPEVSGLLQALLLGYRQELPEKLRHDFLATGTYHIFAISGQHVAIFALFIIVVLQSYRIARVKWFLVLAPLLLIFTVTTGMSTSAMRGCLMAALCFLGPLLARRPDVPSALALAALIILVVNPLQLFDYGFLLSFTAVTGLIVLCPPILQWLTPKLAADPLRLQPERVWIRTARHGLHALLLLWVSSLAAWLVTLPLVARWFNLISPIALLANLAVIPLVTLVLLTSCLALLGGALWPLIGEIFNFANVQLVSLLIAITDFLARVPGGHFFVRAPALLSLALWFGGLAAWVIWRRKAWAWLPALILLILALGLERCWAPRICTVDVLNTIDQPTYFIQDARGASLLIDPGSRYQVHRLIRHLRRQGVNRLSAVILTGTHGPRASSVTNLLEHLPVTELWLPPASQRSSILRETRALATTKKTLIRDLTNGTTLALSPDASWVFVSHPIADGKEASLWLLHRRGAALLGLDDASFPIAAFMRAEGAAWEPLALIENRMRSSARAAPWPEEIMPVQSIICTRSLVPEQAAAPSTWRLAPGQGARWRWLDKAPHWERLAF